MGRARYVLAGGDSWKSHLLKRIEGDRNEALAVATNSHLIEPAQGYDGRTNHQTLAGLGYADADIEPPFISKRGMILISCFIYCALFWSATILWVFG